MAEETLYSVKVHRGIKTPHRYRAGYQFVRNETNIVALSDDELKEVEADAYLEVSEPTIEELENGTRLRKYAELADTPVADTDESDKSEDVSESDADESGNGEDEGEGKSTGDESSDDEGAKTDDVQDTDDAKDEDKTNEGGDKAPKGESGDAVVYTVDELKKKFNTPDLTALAQERGVTVTPEMDTKAKIAEAIVAKQNEG